MSIKTIGFNLFFCVLVNLSWGLDGRISDDDIIALIPRSQAEWDSNEKANVEIIANLGDAAYPALSKAILSADTPETITNIANILLRSDGDKSAPISALKSIITSRGVADVYQRLITMNSIAALAEFGSSKDAEFLVNYLDETDDLHVQLYTLQSISKIGDSTTSEEVESWFKKRQAEPWPSEQVKDRFTAEVENTLMSIKSRNAPPKLLISTPHPLPSASSLPSPSLVTNEVISVEKNLEPPTTRNTPAGKSNQLTLALLGFVAASLVVFAVYRLRSRS